MSSVVRWLGVGTWVALFPMLTAQSLHAGAWLQAEGKNQIIFSGSWTESSHRFDRAGQPRQSGRFTKQEFNAVYEKGWSDTLTAIGGFGAKHQAIPTRELQPDELRSHTASLTMMVGGRVKLWSDAHSVLSLQATGQGSGERSLPYKNRKVDTPAEVDVRLLAGHSFTIKSAAMAEISAFVDVQVAYRWRGGANTDEVRFDATLGIRPTPRVLLILQSFNSAALSDDKRFGTGRTSQHKMQASVVYEMNQQWSLQSGIFTSIRGRESLKEKGIVLSFWKKH